MKPLAFGSLFSGIGGFDAGFEAAGMTPLWQVEIDTACQKVLRHHWPDVERFEDVRNVGRSNLRAVDLICGGFPCQDLSVAGKRAGLAGERSGLWFEFHRVVSEMLPKWVVIENVPGLLSSNDGQDIQAIIDGLTQIGYTVDVDIKDAQQFGVAQRRRRVILTCVRLDDLLRQKTNLSRQVSVDLLAQQLLNTWGAIPQALSLVPLHSVCDKPTERYEASLSRMTSLFEITLERLACRPSRNILDVLLDQFGDGERSSESGLTASGELPAPQLLGRAMCESLLRRNMAGSGYLSISTLLSSALAEGCEMVNKSITSTWTQETIDQRIYTFSVACLNTIALMLHSLDWSVNCWNVAKSVLMLLQENMNYARQASSQLFVEPGLRDSWWNYLSAASHIESELERHIGAIRSAEILFEREGSAWDSTPRRETGQGVTACIEDGAGEPFTFDWQAGGNGDTSFRGGSRTWIDDKPGRTRSLTANHTLAVAAYGGNNTAGPIDIATACNAHGGAGRFDFESETFVCSAQGAAHGGADDNEAQANQLVVATLNSGCNDGGFRTEPGEHLVVVNGNSTPEVSENIALPLRSNDGSGNRQVLAFTERTRADGRTFEAQEDLAYALTNPGSGGRTHSRQIAGGFGVRRLTPIECERLQGFSDGWTAGQSDSARYRQLGNAVNRNVAEWLGHRIVAVEVAA